MDQFKSKITRMISKIKDYDLNILAVEVENSLNRFLENKFAEQGKILSQKEEEEVLIKAEMIAESEGLRELDGAIWNFEQMAKTLVDITPGEMEFAVATHLQTIFREVEKSAKELFPITERTAGEIASERIKREGKIIPFNPQKGIN